MAVEEKIKSIIAEQLGVKAEDIPTLADNALKDACGFTNPKQATHAEICQIFTNAL